MSSLAANQGCGPCFFIQGHLLLCFLSSGLGDVCIPLSVQSFRASNSVDAQHPQNNTVSSRQRDTKLGFQRTPFFFILLDFVCGLSSNSTWLQNDFTPGLLPHQQHNFMVVFFPTKEVEVGLKRLLGPNNVLYCPRQAEKWIKISHNKANGQTSQETINNTHILVNYCC